MSSRVSKTDCRISRIDVRNGEKYVHAPGMLALQNGDSGRVPDRGRESGQGAPDARVHPTQACVDMGTATLPSGEGAKN